MNTPYLPVAFEQGVPCFMAYDVEDYGMPELYGVEKYLVFEERERIMMDYPTQQHFKGTGRPKHWYNRVSRFEKILYQLLGYNRMKCWTCEAKCTCKSSIPKEIVDVIREIGYDKRPDKVWNSIWVLLKANKWGKFYNCIPIILAELKYEFRIKGGDVEQIKNDFKMFNVMFDSSEWTDRSYFPNLRYIALKLLALRGATFEYDIPLLRTPRKLPILYKVWVELEKYLDE